MMRDITKTNRFAIVMLVIALGFLITPNLFAVDQHDDMSHDNLTQDRSQPDQTSSSSHESFDPSGTVTKLAQTFQASVTKDITRVDLCLKRVGSPQGNLWVEVFTCTTIAPTSILTFGTDGREARSGKVSAATVSTDDYDYVSFILPKGIDLISGTAGSRYALVLCGDYDADVSNYIGWYYKDWSPTDEFPYASAYYYDGSWSDWDPSPFRDFSFTTYYGETNEIILDQLSSNLGLGLSFFAYRTDAFDMAANNTWYDYPWNITATVKTGFTHDNTSNPEQITVTSTGTYLISWSLGGNALVAACQIKSRVLDDGTEIAGSAHTLACYYDQLFSKTIIAKIGAGSVIELQVGTDSAGKDIASYDTALLPDATTEIAATISITKLSNDF